MRAYNFNVFLFSNSFHMENTVSVSASDNVQVRRLASKYRVAEKNAIKEDQEFREYQAETFEQPSLIPTS